MASTRFGLILFSALLSLSAVAQSLVTGVVTDQKGQPVIGANLFIEGTYDGGITDTEGKFSFETFEEGEIVLQVSYLGYDTKLIKKAVPDLKDLSIQLKESITTLDAVEISASTFKAGDNSKLAVLKPLDILTTAGSVGDVVAAMQTLPGTQSNPEDGRLFIRGGEARETNIYIDGLRVFSPYIRSVGGSPTRGRYSPMLFKGVSFSTGGYSAAFGQALSGVLDMNTVDEPQVTETNIGIMTIGAMLGHTHKGERQSISFNGSYVNLTPYTWAVPSRLDWINPYGGYSGEAVYRYKTKKGLFKSYISGEDNGFKLTQKDLDTGLTDTLDIQNANLYSNTSYRSILTDNTSIYMGLSIGFNTDDLEVNSPTMIRQKLNGLHARLALKTVLQDNFIVNYGIGYLKQIDRIQTNTSELTFGDAINRGQAAAFIESDYFFSKNLAIKTGFRVEYNTLLKKVVIDPRITLAQKLGENSQISAAYGQFTQEVDTEFLYYEKDLAQEKSTHYLINYNFKTDKQMLRLEGYYKQYNQLLKYRNASNNATYTDLSNGGDGSAYGFDLFWRANQLFKNLDFWVSYSWIEHQRLYRDFPVRAVPSFSTNHNLSVVSKIWMPQLKSQLGITYNMISGRPYENPNTEGFLNERSKIFKSINLSWSYLISPQKILFFSISNAPGFKNEFGYEYANFRDETGLYPGSVIRPNDDRFLFAGFFWTISRDRTRNQLENL